MIKDLSGEVGLVLASLIPRDTLPMAEIVLLGEFFLETLFDSHLVRVWEPIYN
jgi:hypothetical protein